MSEARIYRPSNRKLLGPLALSLGFVGMGYLLLDRDPLAAWLCIGLFGLCAAVFILSLYPRASYLELTEEGFAMTVLFKRAFVPWSAVEGFVPIRIQSSQMVVGWNYAPGFERHRLMGRLSAALSGVQAALPENYGMSAEALAALLNERRVQARAEERDRSTADELPAALRSAHPDR